MFLFIFDRHDEPTYAFAGFEHRPGELSNLLNWLDHGISPANWDNAIQNPARLWRRLTEEAANWTLIVSSTPHSREYFVDNMYPPAQLEFLPITSIPEEDSLYLYTYLHTSLEYDDIKRHVDFIIQENIFDLFTHEQIAHIVNFMQAAYTDGQNQAGAERIDNDTVYVNTLGLLTRQEDGSWTLDRLPAA